MNVAYLHQLYLAHPLIGTDTRKISPGCIFIALKGDNFNGNTFAEQALKSGAAYAVIDEEPAKLDDKFILVDNALAALQQLASYHRDQLNIPVIGITGSNGKTTSKELLNAVLRQKFITYSTAGNLNNHIGVPLTLLSITPDIEIAIIEMGANHQKEIEQLCSIAKPTCGLITNVGKAHLEGFGGFEGVKKGKGELYDFLKATAGTAFVNADNRFLTEMSANRNLEKVTFYGNDDNCLVKGFIVENAPFLIAEWHYENQSYRVHSNLTGNYNLENILSAITVGIYFGLSPDEINRGINSYVPNNNRSQLLKTEKNTLICDYYNANPSSMSVALDNFASIKAEHKAIILGDMFELGEESLPEHRAILEKALGLSCDLTIFIGNQFILQKQDSGKGLFFETTEDAANYLKENSILNSTVLIKGSRGMKLERLLELV